ncbi:MAG: beta-galactosidase [Armatimonadota bacterium]
MRVFLLFLTMIMISISSCSSQNVNPYKIGESGVNVVSAPDGQWQKTSIDGRDAVTLVPGTTPQSSYMYFQVNPDVRTNIGSDFYLTVDIYADGFRLVPVVYNTAQSPYAGTSSFTVVGNGQWQKAVAHITGAKLSASQNGGADFRFHGSDIKIANVEISKEKPNITTQSVKDMLSDYLKKNPRRTDMFYTFGNDADETSAILFKSLGVTSVESYVTWETCERKGEGQWDWTQWDKQVKILKDGDLKWVPFLIVGPAYSTPNWFRASKEHVPCQCLEHSTDSKIESLWNPNLAARIDRFIAAFAKRYKDSGVIESVLLGIQGDFGEAIYSVSGGGWTFDIPGEYHNHPGFWCGDPYALANFKKFVTKRYKTIDALNNVWGTSYQSFDEVDFPGRGKSLEAFRSKIKTGDPAVRRRWIDFIDWYRDSMTQLSDWWMKVTRKYFPETPIYLCTGGDAPPEHGSTFAEPCRVAAKHNAGVRITNEASHYPSNFMITRWVASAGKHYGSYFGFEPAGQEDEKGIVVRIYNATASGANQLHDYNPNVINSNVTMDVQRKHFQYLFHVPSPVVPVAVWYPNVSLTLKWGGFLEKTAKLRDYTDMDFVDESMLKTNALKRNRILVILHGDVMESADAERIAKWIRAGGRAIVMGVPKFESVERTNTPEETLFGDTPKGRKMGKGSIVRVSGWDSLASELRKTMTELELPVYDLVQDGLYGTQLNAKDFLFLNTGDSRKVSIDFGAKMAEVDAAGGTITRYSISE